MGGFAPPAGPGPPPTPWPPSTPEGSSNSSPNLVRRLPPPLRRYTSAARSAWNAASVQAQRAVSGQARARAQRRGRNSEGATARAQRRGRHAEEGSRPVLSRLPLARPNGRLLQRTSPSETSWTTLTDPADSHRLAETLADSAHAYSHHCAHRYARGVVVYVP